MRLVAIHDGLSAVIARYDPQEAAVEATFVNANAAATLKLGQARGIAMLVPARAGLSVAEYAPNVVKKSIVGAGHGEKAQIRMMIGVLLPKADPQSEDAADALAIAVTHAHHRHERVDESRRRNELPPAQRAPSPACGGGLGRGQTRPRALHSRFPLPVPPP